MWPKILQFLAAPEFVDDPEKTRIAKLLNLILASTLVVWLVGLVGVFFVFVEKLGSLIVLCILLAVILGTKLLLQAKRVRGASLIFIGGAWISFSLLIVYSGGINVVNALYLLSVTVIAGLVLGRRATTVVSILSAPAGVGMVVADAFDAMPPVLFPSPPISGWVSLIINLLLSAVPLNMTLRSLNEALQQLRGSSEELQAQREQLQTLVEERTRHAARQASYAGATAAVAYEMSLTGQDVEQFLARSVSVINEHFGFYHTSVLLCDQDNVWLELWAVAMRRGARPASHQSEGDLVENEETEEVKP